MGRLSRFVRTWVVGRLLKRNPLFAVLLWLLAWLRRSYRAAKDVPLSPVRARLRVGSDFLHRRGLVARDDPTPAGELDDLAAFDRASFAAAEVDPTVRDFFEHTGGYAFRYRVRWGRGFRLGARLAARVTSRIEQLNLPGTATDWRSLKSEFVPVSVPGDPRSRVRGWVRTDGTGTAVFVALYGTHERDGERFVNVAVPLPGCNLSTVLRPRRYADDGVEWTTDGGGDPGLFLVTPLGPFRLPLSQRFRVWRPDAGGATGTAALHASHEMWVLGVQFLAVEYRISRDATRYTSTSTS